MLSKAKGRDVMKLAKVIVFFVLMALAFALILSLHLYVNP